jgi:hypothetical protein
MNIIMVPALIYLAKRETGRRSCHSWRTRRLMEQRWNLLRMMEGRNLSEEGICFMSWFFLNICLTKFDYACKSLSIQQLSNLKYVSNIYCMIHSQSHSASSLARQIYPSRESLRWLQRARLLRCTNVTRRSMSLLLVTTCDSSEPWHRIRCPIEDHRPQLVKISTGN